MAEHAPPRHRHGPRAARAERRRKKGEQAMIAMRPILEPDVLELLNDGRFDGDIEGYVVMDGPNYLGHMLYRIDGDFVDVLDCGLQESALVDGGVRACVAAGENAGCSEFTVNMQDAALARWYEVFFPHSMQPVAIKALFSGCVH